MVERRAAIFVLSDVRSGSTLLDQCLGAHEQVASLGEVHWLPAYASQDRSLYNPYTSLYAPAVSTIGQCVFWSAVRTRLGRPFESLELHSGFSQRARAGGAWAKLRVAAAQVRPV